MKDWRGFERIVALLSVEEYENDFTVIPNARIKGFLSGRKRQIDVLVDYRFDSDLSKRIIIDAKFRRRPVDIKEVESFEGMMRDVHAERGFIICSAGYTRSALKRAQEKIVVRLITEDELEQFSLNNWDECLSIECKKGLILWDLMPGVIVDGIVTVITAGKCDECGRFHIICQGCGAKKVFDAEEDWQCGCEGPWFWLTSKEIEETGTNQVHNANYLLLVLGNGEANVIDRRPL